MRVSTLKNDPGYHVAAAHFRVTFNGAVLAAGSFVTADDVKGLIVAPVLAEPGRFATLEGDVSIAYADPGLDAEGNLVTVRDGKVQGL